MSVRRPASLVTPQADGPESVIGTAGDDTLSGGTGNDTFQGLAGNDILNGNEDNDWLIGGDGLDSLYGGSGNDLLSGRADNDLIHGGTGADTLYGGLGDDQLWSTGYVDHTLPAFVDDVAGTVNYLYGEDGADNLNGGGGNDYLDGGADDDYLQGGAGIDTLLGGAGIDYLICSAGNDSFNGGDGADYLLMGDFNNYTSRIVATGGAGADRFSYDIALLSTFSPFASLAAPQRITDFNGGEGDYIHTSEGDGHFDGRALVWRGAADSGFTGTLGQSLTLAGETLDPDTAIEFWTFYDASLGRTVLYVDRNHDQLVDANDVRIEFDGVVTLDEASFNFGAFTALAGTDGNDASVVFGFTTGDDWAFGLAGNDTMDGGFGNDHLSGDGGNDSLHGGDEDDELFGGAGDDRLFGDAGVDTLDGGAGNDFLHGGSEATGVLSGGAGADTIYGSNVGDTLNAENAIGAEATPDLAGTINYLFGGGGNDVLNGGAGNDRLYGEADNDSLTGGAGADSLMGADGDDTMTGGNGSDTLRGGNGNDVLRSGVPADGDGVGYFDQLFGDAGNDTLEGQDGNDRIEGGADSDSLIGWGGNDTLSGGSGIDSMAGFDGDDTYYVDAAGDLVTEADTLGGTDTVISGIGAYTLTANVENLRLTSAVNSNGTGNALDNILYAGDGNNVLNGLGGIDTVSYAFATAGVTVWLGTAAAQVTGGSGSDTLANIENLAGSAFVDSLTGNGLANALDGAAGGDVLAGGNGNDSLLGGAGNDVLDGGAGDDRLDGGTDIDTLSYASAVGAVSINLALITAQATGGSGSDTVLNIENLDGSVYGDALRGNAFANDLDGGAGNDTLTGGGGADVLTGGDGDDVYRFLTVGDSGLSAMDLIWSFQGGDRIDVSVIDANAVLAGNQAFAFIDGAAFSGTDASGQLRYEEGILYGSVDADADAEFAIFVGGAPALVAADFML